MKLKALFPLTLLFFSSLSSVSGEQAPWLDKDYLDERTRQLAPTRTAAPSQWRVIWTKEPSTRATVSWTTGKKGSGHRVRYGVRSSSGPKLTESIEPQRSGAYSSANGEYFHHARLSELSPSTTYDFQIESEGNKSPLMHFTTAPADDRSFRLLFGGDSRTGINARGQVNLLMADLSEKDDELIGFAHGGDYIVSGRNWSQWSTWLSQHELTVSKSGKVLPIIPTRGNHDGGPLYDEIFDTPGGKGKNYFFTRISPEVALVTLNTEISAGGSSVRGWPRPLRTCDLRFVGCSRSTTARPGRRSRAPEPPRNSGFRCSKSTIWIWWWNRMVTSSSEPCPSATKRRIPRESFTSGRAGWGFLNAVQRRIAGIFRNPVWRVLTITSCESPLPRRAWTMKWSCSIRARPTV